ncbi:hypothetical protein [Gordonia crocea]|uniref:Uncharacterized protein n=1 Tax=Gordonia crocea TaxID=589162 RepID=A0A7I9UVS0_9ACTN|nr:hypothetical protein [Gordonia crocea]GED97043.1 hypothetical protein nbrc107697_10820 [Gordonia crocea]
MDPVYLADHSVVTAIPAFVPAFIVVAVIVTMVLRDRRRDEADREEEGAFLDEDELPESERDEDRW